MGTNQLKLRASTQINLKYFIRQVAASFKQTILLTEERENQR
jgi:hypothetical protein